MAWLLKKNVFPIFENATTDEFIFGKNLASTIKSTLSDGKNLNIFKNFNEIKSYDRSYESKFNNSKKSYRQPLKQNIGHQIGYQNKIFSNKKVTKNFKPRKTTFSQRRFDKNRNR